MSMSDCAKCWETPCVCGESYRDWAIEKIDAQIEMLKRVRDEKLASLGIDHSKYDYE
jgi:hypothetical protein